MELGVGCGRVRLDRRSWLHACPGPSPLRSLVADLAALASCRAHRRFKLVYVICVRRVALCALTVCRPVSYKLESKLGSRVELAAAVKACKAAGVGVIADVLFNRASSARMPH